MTTRRLTEVKKESEHKDSRFDRTPTCAECGCDMVKKGQIYVCNNCGATSSKS